MPTSTSAGFSGKVYVSIDGGLNYVAIGEARDATITINQETLDATSFDSVGWMENIPGLKSWEMSTEGLYVNQSFAGNIGQINVQDSLFGGQTVMWKFLPKTGTGNIGYAGEGIVNSLEVNLPVDDVVSYSLSVTGSGYLETYQVV